MSCQNCNCETSNKENLIFEITENESLTIQKHFYTWNGLLNLLRQFSSDSLFKPDEKRFNELKDEYLTEYYKYNYAMEVIKNKVLKENNIVDNGYNISIDFVENQIILYK